MCAAYQKMGRGAAATGRPIVYSLCQYGWHDVWRVGREVGGNLWRTTGDISDHWDSPCTRIGFDQQVGLRASTPAPATGTTPTCSRSATAA